MLEQEATVVDIRQRRVVVATQPRSACQGCEVRSGCGTSLLSASVGRKVIRFELDNTVDARVGDRLVLGLPEHAMLKGSLLMYLLPLGSMLFAALAADLALPAEAPYRDLAVAAAGFAALGASILLGRFGFSRSPAAYTPVILRKAVPAADPD